MPDHERELRGTLVVLAIFVLGLGAVGRKMQFWPIITWPVYGTRTTPFPPKSASRVELILIDRRGDRTRITASDVFPMGRQRVFENAVQDCFDHQHSTTQQGNRRWLATTLQKYHAHEKLVTVEAWEVTWSVAPLELPPLTRDRPAHRILQGLFHIDDLKTSNSGVL